MSRRNFQRLGEGSAVCPYLSGAVLCGELSDAMGGRKCVTREDQGLRYIEHVSDGAYFEARLRRGRGVDGARASAGWCWSGTISVVPGALREDDMQCSGEIVLSLAAPTSDSLLVSVRTERGVSRRELEKLAFPDMVVLCC